MLVLQLQQQQRRLVCLRLRIVVLVYSNAHHDAATGGKV
jgi:hypothetical protein